MEYEFIEGGICAAKGFKAGVIHCGFRRNVNKCDLAMISSDVICAAAAVYTTNKVHGAPIVVTRAHLEDGHAQAIICNSGNANTCAPNGIEIAEGAANLAAKELNISASDIIVASTGVIGVEMSLKPFEKGVPALAKRMSYAGGKEAGKAILTTDTHSKEAAVKFTAGGRTCVLGGIAKGSGMIHPNMATMLAFITSDVSITPEMLQQALSANVKDTFNQISVDGDTSTNDMVTIMANGLSENKTIDSCGNDFDEFKAALKAVMTKMAEMIAGDGEGATTLITCKVVNAETKDEARRISKAVISSNLLKAAVYGHDANWGRVLCAIGYTEGNFSIDDIDVELKSAAGTVKVCSGSKYSGYSESKAAEVLAEGSVGILINMNAGCESAKAWGCDLTLDYVKINSSYRS